MCGRSTNRLEVLVVLCSGGADITCAATYKWDAFGTPVQTEVADIHLVVAKKPFKYLTFKTAKCML